MLKRWKIDYALKLSDGSEMESAAILNAESIIEACERAYALLYGLMEDCNEDEPVIKDAVVWNAVMIEKDLFGRAFCDESRNPREIVREKLAQLDESERKNRENIDRYLKEVKA